jgi:hypothetical protein
MLLYDGCITILNVLYVRVGCAIAVIIIAILLRYVSLLECWWVHIRLLIGRGVVWLYSVAPGLVCLVGSRNVLLVVGVPVLSHPLWPSWMLRWYPRRLGALPVFWTCLKELVQCFNNLTRWFFQVNILPFGCIKFPGQMHNVTTIRDSNRLSGGLEVY